MPSRRTEPKPAKRSLRGLDGLNFLMADVQSGLGPYLSVFLKADQHWQPGPIGLVMSVGSIVAAILQIPAGLLVDSLAFRRALIAFSALSIALGCLIVAFAPTVAAVVSAQILLGAASTVIGPAIAAISLGIVGRRLMPARISRNETFNHAGNFLAAGLAGTLGQFAGYRWIFYLVCVFAAASALIVMAIDPKDIDPELARGGEEDGPNGDKEAIPIRSLLVRRDLLIFLASVVLFHFGNAAMLPLAGQVIAIAHPGQDAMALSACIVAAQLVMIGVAWAVGRAMKAGYGRKRIFLVALAVLPIRGVLFTLTSNPYAVVGIQLLDGVAAGIFGVISVIIASDLMAGTGRFNLAQGLTALAVGIGASLSNLAGGYIVQGFGYSAGFLSLAAVALGALIFFALFMPETKDRAVS